MKHWGELNSGRVQHKLPTHLTFSAAVRALAGALLVMLIAGCAHPSDPKFANLAPFSEAAVNPEAPAALTPVVMSNRVDPTWLKPPVEPFTLGPGDRVEIELIGDLTSKTTTVVAPDGNLYFNLLPGVQVWGLTLAQAKRALEQELSQYVRQQPQVSVILRAVESKRIWILGRVQAPGVYPMATPMTLLEAISLAGGTMSLSTFQSQSTAGIGEELADLRRSFVIRQGKLLPIDFERLLTRGDLTQNIFLQPDDFIYFPGATAREVYVLGAVTQPRAVPYVEGLTVAAAVASAYGTLNGAYLHHVAVVRGSLSQPQVAIIDYKRVIRGEALDVNLQPQDIVYVPFSPYRYIQRYVEIILNTFVSSAAINAGTRAVADQPVAGAGVFIPVGSGIQIIPPAAPPPIGR